MHPLVDFSRSLPDQVFSVVSRFLLTGNNTATNYYVATTGSDSNSGLSASTPFLTVQKGIDTIAAGMFTGDVTINVADGTYNEDIICKAIEGKSTYASVTAATSPGAPAVITVLGNATTPGNVIIVGAGSRLGTVDMANCVTPYVFNGVDLRNNSTKPAFAICGNASQVSALNWQSSLVSGCISLQFGARFYYLAGTAGGTHALASGNFIFCTTGAYVRVDRGVTVTGVTVSVANATRGGFVHFNTTSATYSFTTSSASGASAFAANASTIIGFGSGDTIAINNRSAPVFRLTNPSGNGSYVLQGPATFNLTDCTGGVCRLDQGSTFVETNASTWNYLGTSVATYTIYDSAQNLGLNNFSSAVPTFVVLDTDFNFGYDWRYTETVDATVPGALITAGTGFFKPQGTQVTNYVPLYRANQDEVVDKLEMVSRIGNGAAHTDTYTVYKNGVATTMVLTITNAASGSTTTNPVTLAAGDTLAFLVTVDAASAAEDVLLQAIVRKT